jgi:hypothetical protein
MMASETVMVRDFRCNGCGSPLKIPKNSKGHVKCPSCKNECVIEGLVKNAEMADKENINSGYPLFASPATLHRKLVSHIAKHPYMPLDLFEKGEVVCEEHHCVPAYLFYCNGTGSYTYEAGNVRQHKTAIDLGDRVRVEKESYMEWTQMSNTANVSAAVLTAGNRAFDWCVKELYMFLDPNKLVDFDELDFPHDVVTYNYNIPQAASFSEHVIPCIDALLRRKAIDGLRGKAFQNLSMGGSSIDKDVIRVFLGLYRIVFKYDDEEYTIWVTGDGEKAISVGWPCDSKQKTAIDGKKQAMEQAVAAVPVPTSGKFTAGMWGSLALGILLAKYDLFFLGVIGAIVFYMLKSRMMQPYNAQLAEIRSKFQKEISDLEFGVKNAVQQFKSKKQPLRGIYQHEVSGDESAF